MSTDPTSNPHVDAFHRRQPPQHAARPRRGPLALGLISAVIASSALVPLSAHAATGGVGWGVFGDPEYKFAGLFVEAGVTIVCGEVGKPSPTGPLENIGERDADWARHNLSSQWGEPAAATPDILSGISAVLDEHAGTGDPNLAAALEYGIHRVLYPNDALRNFAGEPMGSYDDVIHYDLISRIGFDNVAAIQSLAHHITAQITSTVAGSGITGSGELVFSAEGPDSEGTVTMVGTTGSVGSIVLENAHFLETGTDTLTDAVAGVTYPIRAVPPADLGLENTAEFRISGSGTFTAPGTSGYAGSITVWWSPTGQQASLSPGSRTHNDPFGVYGEEPAERSLRFQPIVTTTAQAFVQRGEQFRDSLRFESTAGGSTWFRSEAGYLPIHAEGTVYGPFAEPVVPSDHPPAGVPVAGHADLTTGPSGPEIAYEVATRETAATTGYYVWVWSIRADQQTETSRAFLPEGYRFTDRFGLVAETSVTPMRIRATTQVDAAEVALSGIPGDRAVIERDGYWLRDERGNPLSVTVRWDAYFHPGSAPVARVSASDIPSSAVHLGTYRQPVTGPGEVHTPRDAAELGFRAPAAGEGWIVWVFSIRAADQGDDAGYIEEWSDDYGVPQEIQRLAQPSVRTMAQPGARPGGTLSDTAVISGTVPATGMHLVFEGFRVPTGSEDGWRSAVDDLSAVCTPENRIIDTSAEPILVTAPGTVDSPAVPVEQAGLVLWQESVWSIPESGEDPQLIARGECGVAEESSVVVEVTTLARGVAGSPATSGVAGSVLGGEEVWDTVALTGWVPRGGSLHVQLYRFRAEEPRCTEETLLWTSEKIALEGGWFPDGLTVDLQEHGQTTVAPYPDEEGWQIGFVETLRDDQGRTVAVGDCGVPNETLELAVPALAVTGDTPALASAWTLIGTLGVLVGLGLLASARRPKSHDRRR